MPGPYDFSTPYPASEYDSAPPAAPLAPMPNMLSPPGNLPGAEQQILIERVKRMAQSPNKEERDAAQRFMNEWGRSHFMMGLNRATRLPFNMVPPAASGEQQGLSDYIATQGQTGAYSPQNMAFSQKLTRQVQPGESEGAEVAGNAINMLPYFLPMMRRGGAPGGMPPGGPTPPGSPSPLIPESWLSEPANPSAGPGAPPLAPAGPREMQGPSQWPRFLDRMRDEGGPPRPPTEPTRPTQGEVRYGEFQDKGQPSPQWTWQKRGKDGRFEKGFEDYGDVQKGGYDPFRLLRRNWRRQDD
jgi:hypothetical protein